MALHTQIGKMPVPRAFPRTVPRSERFSIPTTSLSLFSQSKKEHFFSLWP